MKVCGTLLVLGALAFLINFASHFKERPMPLRETGVKVVATPPPQSQSEATAETVPQTEQPVSVPPTEHLNQVVPKAVDPDPSDLVLSAPEVGQTTPTPVTADANSRLRVELIADGEFFPARYLERPPANDPSLLRLLAKRQAGEGMLIGSKVQAGYGRLFSDDSLLGRGNNGTAREEPGCFYVRTAFSF